MVGLSEPGAFKPAPPRHPDSGQHLRLCDLQFTGVILLAVGVWGKVSLESYFSLVSEESTNAPYVLIGTGAAIIIFGLFGCFATCRGSPWMLKLVSAAAGLREG